MTVRDMSYTILDTRDGLDWLRETTGINAERALLAVLYGNEDYPERVDLYLTDHIGACYRSVALCSDGLAPRAPYWIKS